MHHISHNVEGHEASLRWLGYRYWVSVGKEGTDALRKKNSDRKDGKDHQR